VTLDGTTQTPFTTDTNVLGPEIVLNGREAGNVNGLVIRPSHVEVLGLNIQDFNCYGTWIDGQHNAGEHNAIAGNRAFRTISIISGWFVVTAFIRSRGLRGRFARKGPDESGRYEPRT
jgi:hypothetical protein